MGSDNCQKGVSLKGEKKILFVKFICIGIVFVT